MKKWVCGLRIREGIILFIFYLTFVFGTGAGVGGTATVYGEGGNSNGTRRVSNGTRNRGPNIGDNDSEMSIFRWGRCYRGEEKIMRCCENSLNTDDPNLFLVCEDVTKSEEEDFIHATIFIGDIRQTLINRYYDDFRRYFRANANTSENHPSPGGGGLREIFSTPLRELGGVTLSHFLNQPIRSLINDAIDQRSRHGHHRALNRTVQEAIGHALDSTLNTTVDEVIDTSYDYITYLEDDDYDAVNEAWWRLRNRSIANIFMSFFNATDDPTLESFFRSVPEHLRKMVSKLTREAYNRFIQRPTNVTWVFVQSYFGPSMDNGTDPNVLRDRFHYIYNEGSWELTLPICYMILPMTRACLNINIWINTRLWTLEKTVKINIDSNLAEGDDSFFLSELISWEIDATGFRDRAETGVCASGNITVLNLDKWPILTFELNCHPVFYSPLNFADSRLCLLYQSTNIMIDTSPHLNKLCVEPIRDTLFHEIVKGYLLYLERLYHLQPNSNPICRRLISEFTERNIGSTSDTFSRIVVEFLLTRLAARFRIQFSSETIQRLSSAVRVIPMFVDAVRRVIEVSGDNEAFGMTYMECFVLLMKQVERQRRQASFHSRRRVRDSNSPPSASSPEDRMIRYYRPAQQKSGVPRTQPRRTWLDFEAPYSMLNTTMKMFWERFDDFAFSIQNFLWGQRILIQNSIEDIVHSVMGRLSNLTRFANQNVGGRGISLRNLTSGLLFGRRQPHSFFDYESK